MSETHTHQTTMNKTMEIQEDMAANNNTGHTHTHTYIYTQKVLTIVIIVLLSLSSVPLGRVTSSLFLISCLFFSCYLFSQLTNHPPSSTILQTNAPFLGLVQLHYHPRSFVPERHHWLC